MARLKAPKSGVTVRMYRTGHGDCFLLALPREEGDTPFYVLIDCGLKPGSQAFIHKKPIDDIVEHIGAATGDKLDLVIITHEHQDHVNGIWRKENAPFDRFTIEEAWMAWTESREDPLAQELRQRHKDTLLGLLAARQQLVSLTADKDDQAIVRLDALLGIELGDEGERLSEEDLLAITEDPEKSVNKQGLKLIKDKASKGRRGVSFLSPGGEPRLIAETGVRAFVFGPPRDANLLNDEDPQGSEAFPDDNPHGFTFTAAARADGNTPPFRPRYRLPIADALAAGNPFLAEHYGQDQQGADDTDGKEVASNAPWRRIDGEWLYAAETLALKLNTGINNTSLVLAFELPKSKRVLLFVGDAQRGNWISWKDLEWQDGDKKITPRELLARTVLYKVGHHGSHNATLHGSDSDEYANLSWMATDPAAAGEFSAMITAVNEWALTKNTPPWHHPLPSIKRALMQKAQGRVFQTDVDRPDRPKDVPEGIWQAFTNRSGFDELYFDYTIDD
jgi:beta-lactamase superfamily II metal-dependent hydrolase